MLVTVAVNCVLKRNKKSHSRKEEIFEKTKQSKKLLSRQKNKAIE